MRVFLAKIAAVGILATPGSAQASIHPRMVSYTSGTETVSAYLALPANSGPRPAIILVHGDHGLNDWIEDDARKLASRGYVALAVDLYRGKAARDNEDAHELMRGLPDDRALRDLQAAFAYLSARREVRKTKIGVIGWNMGGWYALQLAIHEPNLAACVANDSALPTDRADIARIRASVLGNFGADDRGIPDAARRAFESAMQTAGESVDLETYPDAGDPADSDHYRPAVAAEAWNRTVAFFAKTLGR